MRSDHLSKHVKRHPGYQPGMVKKFRRDRPQGLVSILIPNNVKENGDEPEMNDESRKRLKSVLPSRICVTRADSTTEERTEEEMETTARVATVYDGLME